MVSVLIIISCIGIRCRVRFSSGLSALVNACKHGLNFIGDDSKSPAGSVIFFSFISQWVVIRCQYWVAAMVGQACVSTRNHSSPRLHSMRQSAPRVTLQGASLWADRLYEVQAALPGSSHYAE